MPVTEIEIGRGKRGRAAYAFDDVAIVPSRRTRDPEEVSTHWQIDAYRFERAGGMALQICRLRLQQCHASEEDSR